MLLLRETDRHRGLCDKLARCFSDTRDEHLVEHSLPVMIRQRVLGLALGYEDVNDCYLALYCFCGDFPLCAELRTSDRDGSHGTLEALQRIIPAIRIRLGDEVKIIIRGDSGFCRYEIMAWIEQQPGVHYVFGLARNKRLEALLAPTFETLQASHAAACEAARSEGLETPHAARAFGEFPIRPKTVGAARGASSEKPKSSVKRKIPASSSPT